jgi:hypothetical protein
MTTQLVQLPKPKAAKTIHNLTWEQLEELDHSLEDLAGVRLAYLDGTAEIMPIGREHEDFKSTIARLIEAYMDAKDIRFYKRGSPSLGDKELGARNEPDESYNLDTLKPYPDLAIEVVVTSGGINKLGLPPYGCSGSVAMGRWRTGNSSPPGQWLRESSRSELLPNLPIDMFCRYITYYDQYDAVREFRIALRSQS